MRDLHDLDWETITDYIESGQAALLIGPEILRIEGRPLDQAWRNGLLEKFKHKIAYHHDREGLLLFSTKIAKNDAARFVRKFVSEQAPEETVLKKIAQIKFPLVVSTSPDTGLSDVAYKYGVRHRFSYFKNRSKSVEDVEEPQADLPLFYNLCGTVNDDESLILDYEDLFQLISCSLGTPGLPPKLQAALDKVRIFFFIGFQFEKWYTQLLLRLLCGHEESEKYATNYQRVDDHVSAFLWSQFQIEFLDTGQSFLDMLYEKCAARNLLRPLANPVSADDVAIIRLIQTGKDLLAPLERLRQRAEHNGQTHDVTLLLARYNNLLEEKKKGTLDSRDYFVEYNRLIDNMLNLLATPSS